MTNIINDSYVIITKQLKCYSFVHIIIVLDFVPIYLYILISNVDFFFYSYVSIKGSYTYSSIGITDCIITWT